MTLRRLPISISLIILIMMAIIVFDVSLSFACENQTVTSATPIFLQCIGVIKDIILVAVAVVGAYVGINGLNTWKKELHGKIEYELARKIIKASYKFRDAFALVRRRFITTGEMQKQDISQPSDTSKLEERGKLINSYIYDNRWKNLMDAAAELDAEMFEGEVIWDRNIEIELMRPMRTLVFDLRATLDDYLVTEDPEQESFTREQLVEVRNKFLGDRDGSDDLSIKLNDTISAIEAKFKQYIKR